MEHVLTLTWSDEFPFGDLYRNEALQRELACPGVYCWLDPALEQRVYYVGRALGSPNLLKRLQQHYFLMLGGMYCIPKLFWRENRDWTPGPRTENIEVIADPIRYGELLADCRKYADSLSVSVATMRDHKRDEIVMAERLLISSLKPSGNTRGKSDITHSPIVLKSINPPWEPFYRNK